jgi:hypothetical protein
VIRLSQNEILRDKNGKPLKDAFLVKAEINCNGPPITVYGATILTIDSKKSVIKTSEGGIREARNSKIEITDFK